MDWVRSYTEPSSNHGQACASQPPQIVKSAVQDVARIKQQNNTTSQSIVNCLAGERPSCSARERRAALAVPFTHTHTHTHTCVHEHLVRNLAGNPSTATRRRREILRLQGLVPSRIRHLYHVHNK
eukprot:1356034-Pleurochrysis_carterae.AAC.1